MTIKARVFILAGFVLSFALWGCTFTIPKAPTEDSPRDIIGSRGPQSSNLNPFESSSLLVPNPRTRDNESEYSKQYWRARAGLDMWLKATYGNANDLKNLDWFQILRADQRGKSRWEKWGLISDPECCSPGKDCSEKYPERRIPDTHGFDYCPGDEASVGAADPACDFRDQDGRTRAERNEGSDTLSKTACNLQFGWSSGVIGIRKFPNPLTQAQAGVAGQAPRPYIFGVACAACHAGLHPLRAIHSLDHIAWSQMSLNVGNPYLRLPKMLATGMSPFTWLAHHLSDTPPGRAPTTLEEQSLTHLNKVSLIANLDARPQFEGDGMNGPRFFINGTEVVGLDRYLLKKVRGLVTFAARATMPEFDIRIPALRDFVLSFRTYQLPKDLMPDAKARERGSKVYARACATCHSSMRPIEVADRIDRSIRVQGSPVESSDGDFYLGANFLAHRADDDSLRTDYLSNELDVAVDGQFDVCSTQGRARVLKNVSLLNPWLHLPFLSRGSVGAFPRPVCASSDDQACLKNKTYELRRAMKELLEPSDRRRAAPLYLTSNWRLHLARSNVNWTLPSGTSWPLVDQFQVDDFDQDLADSRRTAKATVARAGHEGASGVIQLIEKFLKIYQPLSAANSASPLPSVSSAMMLTPQMIWTLQLGRPQTEALLRAYSSCSDASRVHRFTESGGHDFGVDLKPGEKKDLVEFLIGL